jgi:hypothetical protein
MKLNYRGAAYESTPVALEMSDRAIIGKYRGIPVRFAVPTEGVIPRASVPLNYRGASYLGIR